MPLYLGLDSSTQSLSAIVLEIGDGVRRVVFEDTLAFDDALPGIRHAARRPAAADDPSVAVSSPRDVGGGARPMMARVAASGLDVGQLAAVSGSAQQHGSVYLNASATAALAATRSGTSAGRAGGAACCRAPVSPIWMDSSTAAECRADS